MVVTSTFPLVDEFLICLPCHGSALTPRLLATFLDALALIQIFLCRSAHLSALQCSPLPHSDHPTTEATNRTSCPNLSCICAQPSAARALSFRRQDTDADHELRVPVLLLDSSPQGVRQHLPYRRAFRRSSALGRPAAERVVERDLHVGFASQEPQHRFDVFKSR